MLPAGVFMPHRRLLAAFVEGVGRDGVRRTLQHEAFHQFAHETFGPNVPVWLDEGLAQVFEEAVWTGNGFVVGQVPPRRVRQLSLRVRELTARVATLEAALLVANGAQPAEKSARPDDAS